MRQDATARLALVVHIHQPVGNLDEVVHRACDRCYAPFLASLEKNADIPLTLHVSGCLLEWLEANRPELVKKIGRLAARDQIELQTGGYYEPILAVLPPFDVDAQIGLQTEAVRRLFAQEPRGLWLAERVWEPHLPEALARAAVRYTTLDDTMFRAVGLPEAALRGGFDTEHLGRSVRVYPASKELRYRIPFQDPQKTIELLRAAGEAEPGALLVYADDGEKFGEWPHTEKSVWGEEWLERFWQALREASDWLEVVKLGEHAEATPSRGRVYLPSASYEEMMAWTLPPVAQRTLAAFTREIDRRPDADEVRPFVRGGPWRTFLARYPESDALHKRVLAVGERLRRVRAEGLEDARRDLLAAECNCAYWHGVFGGIYLPHLRNALWRHLIRAEAALDRVASGDGGDDGTLRSDAAVAVFDWNDSTVLEFDHRATGQNVLSVVARRPEAYHAEIGKARAAGGKGQSIHDTLVVKDGVREVILAYDHHLRGAFVDWWIPEELPPQSFGSPDWAGSVPRAEVGKDLALTGAVLTARYGPAPPPAGRRLAVEWNLQLGEPGAPERVLVLEVQGAKVVSYGESGNLAGVDRVLVRERPSGLGVRFRADAPGDLWWFPVETVSASESGLERTVQGTAFLFLPAGPRPVLSLELVDPPR